MSCRRAEDAFTVLLSSCRPLTTPNASSRRTPSSRRLLGTTASASCLHRRPARASRCARSHNGPIYTTQRTVYTEEKGKLQRAYPILKDNNTFTDEPAANLPDAPKVAVLGGGLTGLTTAYYLAQELPPRSKIVLYEGEQTVGGWMRSEPQQVDLHDEKDDSHLAYANVLFERGPRMMSPRGMVRNADRAVMADLLSSMGLKPRIGDQNLNRWIWHNGKLVTVPSGLNWDQIMEDPLWLQILPTALFYHFKHAVFGMGYTPPDEDISVADWVYSYIKSSKVMIPLSAMMHGTWGGDINKLSAMSVFGAAQFRQMKRNGEDRRLMYPFKEARFLQNFVTEERRETVLEWLNWRGVKTIDLGHHGLQSLPRALYDTLKNEAPNVEVRMGCRVQDIEYDSTQENITVRTETNSGAAQGQTEVFDKVISTLPAHQLARITGSSLPALDNLRAVTIMTVNVWWPEPNVLPNGLGYLIPSSCPPEENPERALGVFFDSECGIGTKDSGRGVEEREHGSKAFVLMGGHHYDGVDPPTEEQAIEQAKNLLERHLGISKDKPCVIRARLAKECLPQHNVGHYAHLDELSKQLGDAYGNRLAVAGGSYGRPGVIPAARQGWDVAFAVANEDFLSNGLEEYTEQSMMTPALVMSADGRLVQVDPEEGLRHGPQAAKAAWAAPPL